MQIPTFSSGDDPGPDFAALLRRQGLVPAHPAGPVAAAGPVTHGTTVVAIRYADGVVMAGDRRATSGSRSRRLFSLATISAPCRL